MSQSAVLERLQVESTQQKNSPELVVDNFDAAQIIQGLRKASMESRLETYKNLPLSLESYEKLVNSITKSGEDDHNKAKLIEILSNNLQNSEGKKALSEARQSIKKLGRKGRINNQDLARLNEIVSEYPDERLLSSQPHLLEQLFEYQIAIKTTETKPSGPKVKIAPITASEEASFEAAPIPGFVEKTTKVKEKPIDVYNPEQTQNIVDNYNQGIEGLRSQLMEIYGDKSISNSPENNIKAIKLNSAIDKFIKSNANRRLVELQNVVGSKIQEDSENQTLASLEGGIFRAFSIANLNSTSGISNFKKLVSSEYNSQNHRPVESKEYTPTKEQVSALKAKEKAIKLQNKEKGDDAKLAQETVRINAIKIAFGELEGELKSTFDLKKPYADNIVSIKAELAKYITEPNGKYSKLKDKIGPDSAKSELAKFANNLVKELYTQNSNKNESVYTPIPPKKQEYIPEVDKIPTMMEQIKSLGNVAKKIGLASIPFTPKWFMERKQDKRKDK
jgi:hypothetical protein